MCFTICMFQLSCLYLYSWKVFSVSFGTEICFDLVCEKSHFVFEKHCTKCTLAAQAPLNQGCICVIGFSTTQQSVVTAPTPARPDSSQSKSCDTALSLSPLHEKGNMSHADDLELHVWFTCRDFNNAEPHNPFTAFLRFFFSLKNRYIFLFSVHAILF